MTNMSVNPTLARIYRFFINFCDFEGFSTTITDDDHARQRPPPRRAHHRLRRTRTTGPASPTRPAEKKRLPEDELLHGTAPRGNVTPIGEEGAPPPASRPRRERAAYGAAHQRRRTTPPREPPRTGAPPRKPDKPSLPPRPRVPTRLPHTHYKGKPTTPSSGRTFTRQETEAKAWGLNFRDVLIALGRKEGDGLGADCAGIVTRVGRDCRSSLRPGDRVCMVAEGCMRQYPRAHEGRVLAIPESLSLETAASVLVPGLTAYHCLVDIARLRKGEWVLVHSAAGSTGQMAVRVAQMLGARVLATTSSDEKRRFLKDTFGIPEEHIFHSRTKSFAAGVMRITEGGGVDCVLNTLSGDGLRASWECMAPFGRFIDIGLADINANAALPMAMFSKNVSFRAVNLMWLGEVVTADLLEKTMRLVDDGLIQPPQPLHVFGLPEVEKAFRFLQSGKNIGRAVIRPGADDVIPRWMANRGAKHLIVPSRSGAASKAAAELVSNLTAQGVNVAAPRCDVSARSELDRMLAECKRNNMPPVRGCINASMVLQDTIFENMTLPQWDLTMRSKAQTAWNLHSLLPGNLDFFVLLSSLAGVIGQSSSANYTAGCALQDAVASYRVTACGQRALSLDIGWIGNVGIIAETAAYQRRRRTDQDLQTIDDTELLALLTMACDPDNPLSRPPPASTGQVLFGLRTPADFLAREQEPPAQFGRPIFGAFSYIPGSGTQSTSPPSAQAPVDQPAKLFRQAADAEERVQIVFRALARKLAVAMSISAEDIEPSKPLSSYGVDSLMAVELRNWIGREFATTIAVFEIMGGAPISRVANLVAQRSTIGGTE
ncbi:KR domain-containing protein [Coniochaeta sp. 2T2.1]|nr:KR domain-containing protein [Coniochaeta sp. 2T2.1]